MLKKLAKYVQQYKMATILTVIFTVLEVVFEILIPYMIGNIIDKGIAIGDTMQVYRYGAIMIGLAVAALFCGIMSGRYAAYSSSGYAANLRMGVYKKIQEFSFSNIDHFSTAGLVTRLTTDVTNVQNSYMMIFRMLMRSPVNLFSALVMTVLISPGMSTIFFFAAIFLAVVLFFTIVPAFKLFDRVFRHYDELNAGVQENIRGIRVVKSFVKEDYEIEQFDASVSGLYQLFVKAELTVAKMMPVMMITMYACILALSWNGAHRIVQGSLTTGELTSLFAYVINILMSLMMLSFALVGITLSEASAKRIVEVLDEEVDLKNAESARIDVENGEIVFDHVYFTYKKGSDKFVLRDIDLTIHSGETIGIISGTGSSKSTMANLITRLYDVSKGSVRVGGHDVREYDLKALRDSVSIVLQKNELFSGTILENLRWGKEDATLEECRRVCKIACANEFIENFKDGYDTYIEQGGSNVSGGQKQRLCIARALLKNPRIMIFDDSTSAVDTATDAKIRSALREDVPEITKIIIAQRISSVKDADRIIVLDEGMVSGFDTHERLLESNEIYKAVVKVQTEGNADFDKVGE